LLCAVSYHAGTDVAENNAVNLLDFIITYLAIGSAFAMRSYFLNRRRDFLSVIRAVAWDLLFWLPNSIILAATRLFAGTRAVERSARSTENPDHDPLIAKLITELDSSPERDRIREAAERYSAIYTVLADLRASDEPSGQFEIYDISGHLNGPTGTPCLFRKNFAKLEYHLSRATDDLVRSYLHFATPQLGPLAINELADFFEVVGDGAAKAKTVDIVDSRSTLLNGPSVAPGVRPPTARAAA
jgi:hypothetical protein